jgi:ribonucleotide monophosphatase NagD (HAD superfamily)
VINLFLSFFFAVVVAHMPAVKGLLIDLSGTIHIDAKVIPGAIQAIERLKANNIPFRFDRI